MTYNTVLHSVLLGTRAYGDTGTTSNKQGLQLISLNAPRTLLCVGERVSPHLHQPGQASDSKEAAIMA